MSGDPPSTCICGSDDDYGFMICCDGCDAWMHGPCVKVTKRFATGIEDYYCPKCIDKTTPSIKNGTLSLTIDRKNSPFSPVLSSSSSTSSAAAAAAAAATQRNQQSPLLKLSDELLLWILAFVRCHKSIAQISRVCRQLWRITQDPYLWKHVTVSHTKALMAHWHTHLYPRMMASHLYELNLSGEMPSRAMVDRLRLIDFEALRVLRLEDCRVSTVYRLASTLSKLKVLVAKRIRPAKTTAMHDHDDWDWRPFAQLHHLEELMLWRQSLDLTHHSSRFFSLGTGRVRLNEDGDEDDEDEDDNNLSRDGHLFSPPHHHHDGLSYGVDDLYPTSEGAGAWGGFVTPPTAVVDAIHDDDIDSDSDSGSDSASQTAGSHSSTSTSTGPSTPSEASPTIAQLTAQFQSQTQQRRRRRLVLGRLRRLALINIPSPTMHLGTDKHIRRLVGRAHTYLYWQEHNLMFPVLKTDFSALRHLVLVEACEPAWTSGYSGGSGGGGSSGYGGGGGGGTAREHAQAFGTMRQLESLTLIHPAIRRPFLVPLLETLVQLPRLRALFLAATDDMECVEMIVEYLLHQPLPTISSSSSPATTMTTKAANASPVTSVSSASTSPSSSLASSPRPIATPLLQSRTPLTATAMATATAVKAQETAMPLTTRRWQGRLEIAIQDDLGANPRRRDWRQRVLDSVYPGLDLRIDLFRSEWEDEDAGLRRLCLQAWERTRYL